jgi:hypothetical protein
MKYYNKILSIMKKRLILILALSISVITAYTQCDVCDITDPPPLPSRIGSYDSQYKTICVTKNTALIDGLNLAWYNTI